MQRRGARNKLRIGNFLTFTGSPGIWGPTSTNSAMLAVAEINKRGGILGREIELSIYDAGGPIDEVVQRAEQAIAFDEVDLIMGSHISAVRVALRKVTAQPHPLHLHAGLRGRRAHAGRDGDRRDAALAEPSVDPLARRRQEGVALVSDRQRLRLAVAVASRGQDDTSRRPAVMSSARSSSRSARTITQPHLARIRAAKPDVVLISLIGTDSITFNRAFARGGLAATTLRLAGAMDETVLLGIGADNTENLFCASGYFNCMASRANDEFLSRYHGMFGSNAPPIGSVGQSNYEGLRFLEAVGQPRRFAGDAPAADGGAQHGLLGAAAVP